MLRSLGIFFALAFIGMIFIPMMLMLLMFLFVVKPNQRDYEEDWDAILAEGEKC